MNDSEFFSNLRESFGQSFEDFLNGEYESPEDNKRWTGYVIDNKDPLYAGRVKVMVIGKYDDLDDVSIPWAVPDISYLGSTKGNFIVPETGTILRGYFDDGDIHKPIFDSVAYNAPKQQSTAGMLDYPNKMVLMQTDGGEKLTLNRRTGDIEFKHRSGMIITIDSNGTLNITTGVTDELNPGAINIYSPGGDINIECDDGNINLKTQLGNVTVDSEAGFVELGRNATKVLVNNLPNCLVTGAPHAVGNTNVTC